MMNKNIKRIYNKRIEAIKNEYIERDSQKFQKTRELDAKLK